MKVWHCGGPYTLISCGKNELLQRNKALPSIKWLVIFWYEPDTFIYSEKRPAQIVESMSFSYILPCPSLHSNIRNYYGTRVVVWKRPPRYPVGIMCQFHLYVPRRILQLSTGISFKTTLFLLPMLQISAKGSCTPQNYLWFSSILGSPMSLEHVRLTSSEQCSGSLPLVESPSHKITSPAERASTMKFSPIRQRNIEFSIYVALVWWQPRRRLGWVVLRFPFSPTGTLANHA